MPTLNAGDLEKESTASLVRQFEAKVKQIETLGIDLQRLINQSLITPACGTGMLSIDLAQKVLRVTREISEEIRKRYA